MDYNEESFWAGVVLGQQLRGWAVYGRPEGFDPDGDLILRPITQGIKAVKWQNKPFTVAPFIGTVDETAPCPIMDGETITQDMGVVVFPKNRFAVCDLAERVVFDAVNQNYTINEEINPLTYDDTIVYINSSGAYTMDSVTRSFTSTAKTVDVGTMQEVTVVLDEFQSVESQEVRT
ncbi:MAG: hypothetical protein IJA67_03435 [Oscillospiraceae bacterium]|nr:hypothetical protein [Oscillospiraceae bacterium]